MLAEENQLMSNDRWRKYTSFVLKGEGLLKSRGIPVAEPPSPEVEEITEQLFQALDEFSQRTTGVGWTRHWYEDTLAYQKNPLPDETYEWGTRKITFTQPSLGWANMWLMHAAAKIILAAKDGRVELQLIEDSAKAFATIKRRFRVEIAPDPDLDPIKLALMEAADKEDLPLRLDGRRLGEYAMLRDGVLGRVHDMCLTVCAQCIQELRSPALPP